MATINSIAREYNAQPHEIEAALDLTVDSYDEEVTGYTEEEITEIFTALAELNDN